MSAPRHPISDDLATAWAHHQDGRFPQAEAAYRRLLTREPGNAAILQLLALLSHQTDRAETAIALLRQAIACDPELASAHANLGIIF
jgi:Flp pilus assembly protein TadD